jgi:hypothetical protein
VNTLKLVLFGCSGGLMLCEGCVTGCGVAVEGCFCCVVVEGCCGLVTEGCFRLCVVEEVCVVVLCFAPLVVTGVRLREAHTRQGIRDVASGCGSIVCGNLDGPSAIGISFPGRCIIFMS